LSGGPHPQGRNKVEDPRSGLRHAATGLEGSDAHPPWPRPAGKRRRACAVRRSWAAQRPAPKAPIKAALSYPVGRRGGVRAQLCASRRRAFRPDRSRHAENKKRCEPWRLRSSPSESAHQTSRSAERHRRFTSCDRHPNGPRRAANRGRAGGV